MPHFVVDIEADGPAPALYSMVSFAAVRIVSGQPGEFFEASLRPISDRYEPNSLASCGLTREATLAFPEAKGEMLRFVDWLKQFEDGNPMVFLSDNPGFDFGFLNYYLWAFTGGNPFGHSSRRIGDFAAGLERNFFASSRWKRLRKTPHTHRPLDDARGNVEALVQLCKRHNIDVPFA